jgi:radical SAM-linked protein
MTVLRRALARAVIPVGYSKGFHPQALISMGPAQPLGQESEAEFLDIELVQSMDPRDFQERMNRVLPTGIALRRVWEIPQRTPSLNGTLREQVYCIDLQIPTSVGKEETSLQELVHRFQATKEVNIERRRTHKMRIVDIRPMVKELKVMGPDQLHLVTHFEPTTGSVKPREVLQALLANQTNPVGVRRIRKVESIFVS